jgi:hypothetical protein
MFDLVVPIARSTIIAQKAVLASVLFETRADRSRLLTRSPSMGSRFLLFSAATHGVYHAALPITEVTVKLEELVLVRRQVESWNITPRQDLSLVVGAAKATTLTQHVDNVSYGTSWPH